MKVIVDEITRPRVVEVDVVGSVVAVDSVVLGAIAFLIVMVVSIGSVAAWGFKRASQAKQRYLAGPGGPDSPVSTDPWRRYCCALAAMYARFETRRFKANPEFAYVSYRSVLPYNTVLQGLRRDWGVKSADEANEQIMRGIEVVTGATTQAVAAKGETPPALSARLAAAGIPDNLVTGFVGAISEFPVDPGAPSGKEQLAFDIGRTANLIRWSAYVGFLTIEQAHAASDVVGLAALSAFDGWSDYGNSYTAGLSNMGRGGSKSAFNNAVTWLLDDPASPWQSVAWP